MTEPHDPTPTPADLTDLVELPMQPTGSGVADLEVAYEQMKLSQDDDMIDTSPMIPTDASEDAADSAAHPS